MLFLQLTCELRVNNSVQPNRKKPKPIFFNAYLEIQEKFESRTIGLNNTLRDYLAENS